MTKLHPTHGAVMLLSCLLLAGAAAAQSPPHQGCHAHDGQWVAAIPSVAIPDIALATIDPYSAAPLIYYNPYVIVWLPPQLREWIYAHECAHHALDHLRFGSVTALHEIEADCWATQRLTAQGVLSAGDIAVMEHAIARLLPGHWMHMPGRFRAIELQKCTQYPRAAMRFEPLSCTPDHAAVACKNPS